MVALYKNPSKHGHKCLPPLSRVMVEEMRQSLLELLSVPAIQVPSWSSVQDGLSLLAKQLDKYTHYLNGAAAKMNSMHKRSRLFQKRSSLKTWFCSGFTVKKLQTLNCYTNRICCLFLSSLSKLHRGWCFVVKSASSQFTAHVQTYPRKLENVPDFKLCPNEAFESKRSLVFYIAPKPLL